MVTSTIAIVVSNAGDSSGNQSKSLDEGYALEEADIFTYSNLVVITNTEGAKASSEKSNVKIQSSFDSVSGLDVVVVDGSWVKSLDSKYVAKSIKALTEASHPVLLLDESPEILTNNIAVSHAFTTVAEVYGFFYDNNTGVSYCNSVTGADLNDSLSKQYVWAKGKSDAYLAAGVTPTITNSGSEVWVLKVHCTASANTGNFGELNVSTYYYALQENDTSGNYIMTMYQLQGDPFEATSSWDNWIAVADMYTDTTLSYGSPTLLTYAPLSTGGSSTVGINLSISAGTTGINGTVGASWSYTIPDVVIHNQSNYSQKKFDIWHDFNENGVNKTDTHEVRPGKISKSAEVSTGSIMYNEIDHYAVQFYKDRTLLADQFETCNLYVSVAIVK
ncbi:MAG: hypothetical protein LBS92_06935 [Candidatus Methanoplasma sp.]|nr:hypothetical protein [Candidatus Methanoplasma sp.]